MRRGGLCGLGYRNLAPPPTPPPPPRGGGARLWKGGSNSVGYETTSVTRCSGVGSAWFYGAGCRSLATTTCEAENSANLQSQGIANREMCAAIEFSHLSL